MLLAPCLASPCAAQLLPDRLYVPLHQAIGVRVAAPDTDDAAALTIRLIDPASGRSVSTASAAPGPADLSELFPTIWTTPRPRTLLAQLSGSGGDIGAPLIVQPLLQSPSPTDRLTHQALAAVLSGDTESLRRLSERSAAEKERLRAVPEGGSGDEPPVLCGVRIYEDRLVRLTTTAGVMEVLLRPEFAPNTSFHFRGLVEGGLYDETIVHRVVATDARGRPFLMQLGDPTGRGVGGPGFNIGFEPSALAHDFGVVSLARRPAELNSGGSQFFICLSRDACAPLDGAYTAFGQVVSGADTLLMLSAVPTGPIDPSNPASPHERPLDPPVILRAELIPAPPYTERSAPVRRDDERSIER